MATIGLESGSNYPDQMMGMQSGIMRRPLFPAVRWGAILAGVAVGISIQLVLTLLGIATGLTTTNVAAGESIGRGPLIWAGLSMLIAAFVGGYVAARMSGLKRKVDGVLHGAVSWAVTTLMFVVLATSAGGSLVSGVFNTMSQSTAARGGGASAIGSLLSGQPGGTTVDAATMRRIQQLIQAGQRDEAISAMVSSMGLDRTRATTVVDQALILSGSPEKASPEARAAAENAIRTAGNAAWAAFIAVILSLALGIIGGIIGALTSRRKTWTDTAAASDGGGVVSETKVVPSGRT